MNNTRLCLSIWWCILQHSGWCWNVRTEQAVHHWQPHLNQQLLELLRIPGCVESHRWVSSIHFIFHLYLTYISWYLTYISWESTSQISQQTVAITSSKSNLSSGIILGMDSANERRCYTVTSPLISCAHTENDPWFCGITQLWSTLSCCFSMGYCARDVPSNF